MYFPLQHLKPENSVLDSQSVTNNQSVTSSLAITTQRPQPTCCHSIFGLRDVLNRPVGLQLFLGANYLLSKVEQA